MSSKILIARILRAGKDMIMVDGETSGRQPADDGAGNGRSGREGPRQGPDQKTAEGNSVGSGQEALGRQEAFVDFNETKGGRFLK